MAPADWLALPSTTTVPDMMFSATPDAGVAVHAHGGVLVHAGAVVAGVALDLDLDRRVDAGGERVRAARVEHPPAPRPVVARPRAARRSARAAGSTAEVDLSASSPLRPRTSDRRPLPAVDVPGLGLPHRRAARRPGSTAIARYSEAIATQSSVSAITAGLHGDRVAQDREAVGRADRERVEAVEVVEAALERLLQRWRPRASGSVR